MNREFLQLAHTYNPDKDFLAGKFMSEKLDGQRFFWDACTRGKPIEDIPWANTEKSNAVPISTGLWSRYGNPIVAPDFWLDALPEFMVEGEMFIGYGQFQYLMSITRRSVNSLTEEWQDIKAYIFDSPHPDAVFMDGKINNPNYRKIFQDIDTSHMPKPFKLDTPFQSRTKWLKNSIPINGIVRVHEQVQLPFSRSEAEDAVAEAFEKVLAAGGEGLIIKNPNDVWHPKRVKSVLKHKPEHDAEAEVLGYMWGRETDRGSKLMGLMGALICKIDAGTFKLSGFTDEERVLVRSGGPTNEGSHGQRVVGFHSEIFPIGSKITYKYRETTNDGLPKDGRYWRRFAHS